MTDYVSLVLNGCVSNTDILRSFYDCLPEKIIGYTNEELVIANKKLFDILYSVSVDNIINILGFDKHYEDLINSRNIPQFSTLDIFDDLLEIVETNPNSGFADIGYYFNKNGKEGARAKYGENHYKIIAALGLFAVEGSHNITHLGKAYMNLSEAQKKDVRIKLYLRILIVRLIMHRALLTDINVSMIMSLKLSASTVIRRRPNVKCLVDALLEKSENKDLYDRNIIWY